jgi:hypothetical protein
VYDEHVWYKIDGLWKSSDIHKEQLDTDRQTGRKTDKHDSYPIRQSDRQTGRKTDIKDRYTDRQRTDIRNNTTDRPNGSTRQTDQ